MTALEKSKGKEWSDAAASNPSLRLLDFYMETPGKQAVEEARFCLLWTRPWRPV